MKLFNFNAQILELKKNGANSFENELFTLGLNFMELIQWKMQSKVPIYAIASDWLCKAASILIFDEKWIKFYSILLGDEIIRLKNKCNRIRSSAKWNATSGK